MQKQATEGNWPRPECSERYVQQTGVGGNARFLVLSGLTFQAKNSSQWHLIGGSQKLVGQSTPKCGLTFSRVIIGVVGIPAALDWQLPKACRPINHKVQPHFFSGDYWCRRYSSRF